MGVVLVSGDMPEKSVHAVQTGKETQDESGGRKQRPAPVPVQITPYQVAGESRPNQREACSEDNSCRKAKTPVALAGLPAPVPSRKTLQEKPSPHRYEPFCTEPL